MKNVCGSKSDVYRVWVLIFVISSKNYANQIIFRWIFFLKNLLFGFAGPLRKRPRVDVVEKVVRIFLDSFDLSTKHVNAVTNANNVKN